METPKEAHFRYSIKDGSKWQLVFSDEFNTDGRSFYPGDDPYWEAVDLHYWVSFITGLSAFLSNNRVDVRLPTILNGTTLPQ